MTKDTSNGYDSIANKFIVVRSESGRDLVKNWAASFPQGSSVIDIGAGDGEPLTSALIESGMKVFAIDASPKMVAAFRRRFPDIEIACEAAETSLFFGRTYDAALAVGLLFLLPEKTQRDLIGNIAKALNPGGRLLFSAPQETGEWTDVLTERLSISLGSKAYHKLCRDSGLEIINEMTDEGGSNYYEACKI